MKRALVLVAILGAVTLVADLHVSLAGVDQNENPIPHGDPPDPSPPGDSGPVPSGVQVFDDQVDFLAAAGALTTEDFEDEPVSGTPNGGAVEVLMFDDFTAESDPAALKILDAPFFGNHNTTPGGSKFLSADTDVGFVAAEVAFTFDVPISKLGMFLIDIDVGDQVVTINGVDHLVPQTPDGGEAYFGIISDLPFTTILITNVGGQNSHYSMDDVAYGGDDGGVPATGIVGTALILLTVLGAGAYLIRQRATG